MTAPLSSPDLAFRPLGNAEVGQWSRPTRFDFFDVILTTPIADSELLHLSHYGPIAIRLGEMGPEVVMVLHSALSTAPLLSPQARWVPPYAPLALRSLPFRMPATDNDLEFAPSLCDAAAEQHTFVGENGEPSPALAYITGMLQQLSRGRARLSQAAKALLAADLLAPLYLPESHAHASLFVPQAERIARLSALQAAALTLDANLPMEVVSASLFSQRWLRKGCIQDAPSPGAASPAGVQAAPPPPAVHDSLDQPLLMDDSSLFSIEAYLGALDSNNGSA